MQLVENISSHQEKKKDKIIKVEETVQALKKGITILSQNQIKENMLKNNDSII